MGILEHPLLSHGVTALVGVIAAYISVRVTLAIYGQQIRDLKEQMTSLSKELERAREQRSKMYQEIDRLSRNLGYMEGFLSSKHEEYKPLAH